MMNDNNGKNVPEVSDQEIAKVLGIIALCAIGLGGVCLFFYVSSTILN